MHSYYTFLALDVAQERSREAERLYHLRRAARGSHPERLLDAIARRLGRLVFGGPKAELGDGRRPFAGVRR